MRQARSLPAGGCAECSPSGSRWWMRHRVRRQAQSCHSVVPMVSKVLVSLGRPSIVSFQLTR